MYQITSSVCCVNIVYIALFLAVLIDLFHASITHISILNLFKYYKTCLQHLFIKYKKNPTGNNHKYRCQEEPQTQDIQNPNPWIFVINDGRPKHICAARCTCIAWDLQQNFISIKQYLISSYLQNIDQRVNIYCDYLIYNIIIW